MSSISVTSRSFISTHNDITAALIRNQTVYKKPVLLLGSNYQISMMRLVSLSVPTTCVK